MKKIFLLFVTLSFFGLADASFAQTGRKPRKAPVKVVQPKPAATVPAAPAPVETLPAAPGKKNERADARTNDEPRKANSSARETEAKIAAAPMPFAYEFNSPQFLVRRVFIEHDENGKGKITFEKINLDEPITDPLQVSPAALEKIKGAFDDLKFLDSTEKYQSVQYDYPHLGTMKLTLRDKTRERTAEFNWTDNKIAEELAKEYKRLTEQFIWMFEMNLARENQPLEAPKLMDKIDTLIKRNEVSDLKQMQSYLREIADDERLPLIARNRAEKIIKQIEKQKDK